MKNLQNYWGETSDQAKKANIARKSAQLNLNAQRAVLDAEAKVEAAKAKRDAYITKSVSVTEPDFMLICTLVAEVQASEEEYAIITSTQKALFA